MDKCSFVKIFVWWSINLHFLLRSVDTEEGDEIHHAWYQWVVFVLFFQVLISFLSWYFDHTILIQAILCYLPHSLWKNWEGGKLSLLLQVLTYCLYKTLPGYWVYNMNHQGGKELELWSRMSVFQGLDQLSLDGVEGTKEKRKKIVMYVMSNLHRWTILIIVFNNLWQFSCLQSQHICLQVHSLWAAEPDERFRANVAHGCLLWGPVHIIRPGGRLYVINALDRISF